MSSNIDFDDIEDGLGDDYICADVDIVTAIMDSL